MVKKLILSLGLLVFSNANAFDGDRNPFPGTSNGGAVIETTSGRVFEYFPLKGGSVELRDVNAKKDYSCNADIAQKNSNFTIVLWCLPLLSGGRTATNFSNVVIKGKILFDGSVTGRIFFSPEQPIRSSEFGTKAEEFQAQDLSL